MVISAVKSKQLWVMLNLHTTWTAKRRNYNLELNNNEVSTSPYRGQAQYPEVGSLVET